jgi:carboxylesterase type B
MHHAKAGKTFLYHFSMDSKTQNHLRNVLFGPDLRGVCHADELFYIFSNAELKAPPTDSVEFDVIRKMVRQTFKILN